MIEGRKIEIDLDPNLVSRDVKENCFACLKPKTDILLSYENKRGEIPIEIFNIPGYQCLTKDCYWNEIEVFDVIALTDALRSLRKSLPFKEFSLTRTDLITEERLLNEGRRSYSDNTD